MECEKYKLTPEQQEIFDANIKLVKYTIFKYFSYQTIKHFGILAIENAGYLGLVYAIKTYSAKNGTSFSTWGIKCIRFKILNYMKQQEKKVSWESTECMELSEFYGRNIGGCRRLLLVDYVAPQIEDLSDMQVVEELYGIAKSNLTENQYRIFMMRYKDGKEVRDIAKELEITTSRIYSVLDKSVRVLQQKAKVNGMMN